MAVESEMNQLTVQVLDSGVQLHGAPPAVERAVKSQFHWSSGPAEGSPLLRVNFVPRIDCAGGLVAGGTGVLMGNRFFLRDRHGALAEIAPRDLRARPAVDVEDATAAGFFVPNVLIPSIQAVLGTSGSLVHAAALVAPSGRAVLLPAWGGIGKTSTLLELVRRHGFRILADDLALVAADGRLHKFIRSVNLLDYNVQAFPELRRFTSVRTRAAMGVRSVLAAGRAAALTARGSDSTMAAVLARLHELAKAAVSVKVPIESIEGQPAAVTPFSPPLVSDVIALQRAHVHEMRFAAVEPEWIGRTCEPTLAEEFSWYDRGRRAAASLDPMTEARFTLATTHDAIASALRGARCQRLQVPMHVLPADVARAVAAQLEAER